MGTIWFCLVVAMFAAYVVLDGFDLGVGILHLWVARTDSERRLVLRSIGPVWDGNEVWLIAAGGTLYFSFPQLYATGFSGFYLPLTVVLWLFIIRGISIEFRAHLGGRIWPPFWDAGFMVASLLLAIVYGVALGNIVRGVPFDSSRRFFEPLWTNFLPRGNTGILDWYTIAIGIVVCAALALHGAAWLLYKTEGELTARALRAAGTLWWVLLTLTIAITIISFRLLPQMVLNFKLYSWGFIFPVVAVAGLFGIQWFIHDHSNAMVFASSCVYLTGMLTSVAFTLYPKVLPSSTDPGLGLTISSAKAADYGLRIGLVWWLPGVALAVGYSVLSYRGFAGKLRVEEIHGERPQG